MKLLTINNHNGQVEVVLHKENGRITNIPVNYSMSLHEGHRGQLTWEINQDKKIEEVTAKVMSVLGGMTLTQAESVLRLVEGDL